MFEQINSIVAIVLIPLRAKFHSQSTIYTQGGNEKFPWKCVWVGMALTNGYFKGY